MIRGRHLENALALAARAYERQGRCSLTKIATPTFTRRDGAVGYSSKAGLDFRGSVNLAGVSRPAGIEAKETSQDRLDLSHWPEHQRDDMARLYQAGWWVRLVVAFTAHQETYSVDWPALELFLRAPWRQSLSFDWCRAHGEMVLAPCQFLDARPHALQAAALADVEADRCHPPRAKPTPRVKPPRTSLAHLYRTDRDAYNRRIFEGGDLGMKRVARGTRRRRVP